MDSTCIKQTVCIVLNIFQHGKYLVAYVLNENRSKVSEDMERTRKCYGRNDGLTDKGHYYYLLTLRGLRMRSSIMIKKMNLLFV